MCIGVMSYGFFNRMEPCRRGAGCMCIGVMGYELWVMGFFNRVEPCRKGAGLYVHWINTSQIWLMVKALASVTATNQC